MFDRKWHRWMMTMEWHHMVQIIRAGCVGLWLMALYVVAIAIALMTFSAFQFQTLLDSIDASGRALTIGELERERDTFRRQLKTLDEARTNASDIQSAFSKVAGEKNQMDADIAALYASQAALVVDVELLFERLSATTSVSPHGDTAPTILKLAAISTNVDTDDRNEIQVVIKETQRLQRDLSLALAKGETLQKRTEDLTNKIDESNEWVHNLEDMLKGRPELTGLFQQLNFFENVYGRVFVTMPSSLLVPVVTLAMGALGSVIYLSVGIVVGESYRPFAWYVFRPMLGMVTAFAVFILVQAGALVVSQPQAQSTDLGQLNPYFIAFVAIISGLLSEQAVQRIRTVAGSFFSIPDDPKDDTHKQSKKDESRTEET